MPLPELLGLFEAAACHEGLLQLTQGLLGSSTDELVHTKHIEAAARLGRAPELERATRESHHYNVERTIAILDEWSGARAATRPSRVPPAAAHQRLYVCTLSCAWHARVPAPAAADPRPLINVCDKHDLVPRLTKALYERKMLTYLNVYVPSSRPPTTRTPQCTDAHTPVHRCAHPSATMRTPQCAPC